MLRRSPGGARGAAVSEWPAGSPVPGPRMAVNHRNQFSSLTPQRTTFVPIQATRVCPGVSSAGCKSCFFGVLSCFGEIPIFYTSKTARASDIALSLRNKKTPENCLDLFVE